MDNREVMVTIRCLAYNHEPYIRQCLEGFVMQKTNFRFEAIVHDDASTDGTAAIIREYAEKYPDIIKPIFETENQYSKRDGSVTRIMNAQKHGKYVAMCEGDDYWIDPLKLQKQVDFLEANPEYSATFFNIIERDEQNNVPKEHKVNLRKHEYNLFDVLSGVMFGIQSICYRSSVIRHYKSGVKGNGDLLIYYFCTLDGPVYRLDGYSAVYRKTGKGIATRHSNEEQLLAEFKERFLFHEQLGFPNYNALILSQVRALIHYLVNTKCKTSFYKIDLKPYVIKRKFMIYIVYFLKVLSINAILKILHR